MKNLLLVLGLTTSLIFCGDYNKAQGTIKTTLEIPESVRKYGKKLEKHSSGEHVLVRLARDIDVYIVTSRNGWHINFLAEKLGIHSIRSNRNYSSGGIAFPSGNLDLKQMAKKLDTDGNGIIDLDELGAIY